MATQTRMENKARSFGQNIESDLASRFLRVVEVAAIASSYTGQVLAPVLRRGRDDSGRVPAPSRGASARASRVAQLTGNGPVRGSRAVKTNGAARRTKALAKPRSR